MPWTAWDDLAERSPQSEPFVHSVWLKPWLHHLGHRTALHVVLIWDAEDRLVGGLPLVRTRRPPGVLEVCGARSVAPDHFAPLADPDHSAAVHELIIDHLVSARPSQLLNLESVAEGGFLASLSSTRPTLLRPSACPQVTLPRDWTTYLAGRGGNLRSQLSRSRRKLEALGVRHELVAGQPEVAETMHWLLRTNTAYRESRGESSAFSDPRVESFHQAVAAELLAMGRLRLHRLVVGDRIIAATYCIRWSDRVLFYNTAYDVDWAPLGPGTLVLAESIRSAIEEGASTFDLLRGDHGYKDRFMTHVRSDQRAVVGLGVVGATAVRLVPAALSVRRAVKHAVQRWRDKMTAQ